MKKNNLGKTILIIEDDHLLLGLYKSSLELEGFRVDVANNGHAGFTMAKSTNPDLILLDVIMPELDGFSLLSDLKSEPTTKHIPVIIFSNLSQKEEIERGIHLGAKDYIVKTSVTPKELAQKVRAFLENNI